MQMFLQSVFFVTFPAVIIWGAKRSRVLKWLSPVVLCYITGMLLANIPVVPLNKELSINISGIAVFLAIPLLLFSTDFVKWLGYAKKTILSFLFCITGIIISSIAFVYFFGDKIEESWKIGGMLVGVYTGGTPNMSAIGLSLDVKKETFVLLNAADVLCSSIYFIFLMLLAQRLLLKFLPAFKRHAETSRDETGSRLYIPGPVSTFSEEEHPHFKFWVQIKNLSLPLSFSLVILGIGIGLSYLIVNEIAEIIVILTVTTLGIAASFTGRIRNLKGAYEAGEYLMLVFCIAIGSMADFGELLKEGSIIISSVAVVMTGAILIHFVLAAIFRIDADTVIITSTAGIFGAPFIAPIASVLKNRDVLVAGLTTSLIGYALGNYLGLAVAYLLKP